MKKNATWIVIGVLAAFMVVAVIAFGDGSTDSEQAAGTGIPVQDPDLVAAGDVVYQASCAQCHGSDLKGSDQGPSHLSVLYQPSHHGDIAFVLAARNGVRQHHWSFGDMPAVPGLSDEDLEAIVAFVRENQRIFGFEPFPP